MMRGALMALACAAIMLSACSEPLSRERFIRSDGTGEYAFTVDFSDSTAVYDLSFYTRIDKQLMQPDTLGSFPMKLLWRSPSGLFFSETVYYPADSVKVFYRRGLEPAESGTWELQVSIPDEPTGLRGMGLVVAKVLNINSNE